MSKSRRTQQRYQRTFRNQTTLDLFGLAAGPSSCPRPLPRLAPDPPISTLHPHEAALLPLPTTPFEPITSETNVTVHSPSSTRISPLRSSSVAPHDAPLIPRRRSASVLSWASEESPQGSDILVSISERAEIFASPPPVAEHSKSADSDSDIEMAADVRANEESWEDELGEAIAGSTSGVRNWSELREKVKQTLRKESHRLSLPSINQLMILANFATLLLKGYSRMTASEEIARQWHEGTGVWFARRVRALARHYQTFGRLPIEKRGGSANARSWLNNEFVKTRTRQWLTAQKTGEVTPKLLRGAVNDIILPDLNITPKEPICVRTAQRWLHKLGWRPTTIRQGVYMDGHERTDVVDDRDKRFLPQLLEYERRMVHFEGPELMRVEPKLEPGEKEIIAQYHDESCFHANEASRTNW